MDENITVHDTSTYTLEKEEEWLRIEMKMGLNKIQMDGFFFPPLSLSLRSRLQFV